ncbi:UDP-N-acetylglucosamine transporter TMEM241 homolog isoform X7 [Acropora palmata]|uniref:UDP-N-acetylglucosamine transporter TMEM241 homolog isoform X7 n=1 Tax=Acropora palmata TaxID=6131 RepID=UPI003DA0D9B3
MCVILVFFIALLSGSKKALKNSDLNRDSNPDLCNAGAGALPVKLPSGFLESGHKDLPINSQFSLIVTALAVVMVAATDTQVILSLFLFFFYCVCVFLFVFSFFFFLQFDQIGYKWMMIHCTFSAAYVLYGNSLRKNSLSDLNKMFCNAVTSVILLMTISVTTGELFRLIEFPYLYSSSFHLWCMTSGLCGTALSVCHGFLLGTDLSHSIAKITSFNRVAISLLSLFIFDMSPSANMAVSIAVALFSGVLHSYSDASHRESEQLSQIEVRES